METITLDDVRAFYAAHMPRHMSGVLISSDRNRDDLVLALKDMSGLELFVNSRDELSGVKPISERRLYLVDKDEAAQSIVRTVQESIKYDALGDYYLAGLMNFTLGGTFNSRINLNLREDKGYTYGARTSFSGGDEFGVFGFGSEVNKDATAKSITEVLNELERYSSEGMTEDEFTYMVSARSQRDALQYETPGRKLGLLAQMLRYDLPSDYRNQQQALLQETSREKLNELAGSMIQPDRMAIVVVGDEDAIRPELEELGLPITRLNEDGEVIEGD